MYTFCPIIDGGRFMLVGADSTCFKALLLISLRGDNSHRYATLFSQRLSENGL